MKKFRKILVANRGEIAIRVFRTASELGLKTVAIYSYEDRYALHRLKADEAYLVGKQGEPIRAYLDIPGIIQICKEHEVDCLHPGYGFLSERPELARACEEAGVAFIGPSVEVLDSLGDKLSARMIAEKAQVPVLPGTGSPVRDPVLAEKLAEEFGYPIILKAAKGGGGRGMRVVNKKEDFKNNLEAAMRESLTAFGSDEVFIEKFIPRPKHIEVQLLGDRHGNLVHLYERDCSLQRRHQKVVEIAPGVNLDPQLRQDICDSAVKIGKAVNYYAAGTVEFLVDTDTNKYYFIEVNPRIQVEHTITEAITGCDIVKSQILVTAGVPLSDDEIGYKSQDDVVVNGYAIQCRVTTEDPENKFQPDYGHITHYRSAGGMGVRLDGGTAFSGALVTPYYDSMLVKVITWGRRFQDAAGRMLRSLQEFRLRGVKTNIPFLVNVMQNEKFLTGDITTRFIDDTPELLTFTHRKDRATKIFNYLADVIVNKHPDVKLPASAAPKDPPPQPKYDRAAPIPKGTRDKLKELGPKKFAEWVRQQKQLMITDTTFRDAHQSLLATRVRTYDLLGCADAYARLCPQLFSMEMWGGATFDTAMRFLKEDPWQRLEQLRERIPNILFQMLLRASNAVGYSNYPDNLVKEFVRESAKAGMNVFRIFDPLNSVDNMRVAVEAAVEASGEYDVLCEPAVCYTGDLLNPNRPKYDLKYYVKMAKELEKLGAHVLGIKDMAGLCKPLAAEKLVKALKEEVGIPIHFHTHDSAGIQSASILKAAEAGLDIADCALGPMSGTTSQVNLNSVVEMMKFSDRDTGLNTDGLRTLAHYWEGVRNLYFPFESGQKSSSAEVYFHEMPGGQYTNLFQQAVAVGIGDRWDEVCDMYGKVNTLFGDIVKVTPTSKSVGDMAIFMVSNNLQPEDIVKPKRELAFPAGVIDLMAGRMGYPPGGFPEDVQKAIIKNEKAVVGRPGASLPPADFEKVGKEVEKITGNKATMRDIVTYIQYPKVFKEFHDHQDAFSDTSVLPTRLFFYGQEPGEETSITIEQGKTLIVKFLTLGDPTPDGMRTAFFELNGQPRNITVADAALAGQATKKVKADPNDAKQLGAPMPGMVVNVPVNVGDKVAPGQKLVTMEAMKMETSVIADKEGVIAEVLVRPGSQVESGDLMIRLG